MNLMSKIPNLSWKNILPALDILALFAWGTLLFKYWQTGQLRLLIHPNYFGLVFITSMVLFLLGIAKTLQFLEILRKRRDDSTPRETVQHITLFPPGIGSGLLVITALIAFLIPPTVLTSQIALQRGVSESLPITQNQPQAFRSMIKPEDRSLIEWVRTLNAYPEPDAYAGQKAKVSGFVIHLPQLPDNYLLLSRFILTCCAIDAYPVGIPVKLSQNRSAYPQDSWLEIEGEMATETIPSSSQNSSEKPTEKRQLVIVAKSIKPIPTPADPYSS
jgi:putative membrane protein